MGATPSHIENEVADPDSESEDDEVIKIQHHRRYRVSLHYCFNVKLKCTTVLNAYV